MTETALNQTKKKNDEAFELSKVSFGFWVYIMTDCILFAGLFAVYAVLHRNTYGGPSGQQLFNLPNVLIETIALLTSSFSCGLGMVALQKRDKNKTLLAFAITFVLGLVFLVLELTEFRHLAVQGNSWRRSGFLSSFFALVSTHGLHITCGLIWMLVMMIRLKSKGFTQSNIKKLTLLSLFWHFLDIIWIFIFTIVYLFGVVPV